MWTIERIINKVSKPYPYLFPTTFDLIPLMSFQTALDPDLKICRFVGSVSVSLGSGRDQFISKEHDIKYIQVSPTSRQTIIEYDSGDLGNNLTQKALWSQVLDDLGADAISELNIGLRCPMLKAPDELDLGVDQLLLVQSKTGNFTRSLRERFNLHGVRNPYLLIRNELVEKGLWKKHYSRKLRGVLKTKNLAGLDKNKLYGWESFLQVPEGHRFPPEANKLNMYLITDRWWQDNGIPVRMLGAINSSEVEAILYLLQKRRVVITA